MDKEFGIEGWEPKPILLIETCPAGPVEERFFKEHLTEVEEGLRKSMPLDAVYICQHGEIFVKRMDKDTKNKSLLSPDVYVAPQRY